MSDQYIDVVQEVQGRHLMVRFYPEADRLRVAVSIPNGAGEEEIQADDVDLEVELEGKRLELAKGVEVRKVRTETRGVTEHVLYELALPRGVKLQQAVPVTLECAVSLHGERRTFGVQL